MVGDEAAYPMQSVVKFVLALSVLKRVDQGAMNLEQIIRIRPEQLVKDTWSPLRERFPQGGDFSLKELLRVTVQESDNNTCDLLFGLIGGPQAVQKDLKEWGIDGINVRFTEEEIHRNHDLQYVNSSRPSAMIPQRKFCVPLARILPSSNARSREFMADGRLELTYCKS